MRYLESLYQKAICDHLIWRAAPGLVWFAVPNGGRRNRREAARMKGEGVKAGAPDMIFTHDGRSYFLELKTENGVLSPAQKTMLAALELTAPGSTHVAYGLDDALAWLEAMGLMRAVNDVKIQQRSINDG